MAKRTRFLRDQAVIQELKEEVQEEGFISGFYEAFRKYLIGGEEVTPEIWQYQIGGYQVCYKWLKDRKGKTLSFEDIKHYCKIATALKKTIEVQEAIDKIYSQVEEQTIAFGKTWRGN